uniref:hypothetical protein n=1 Tax=Paracoccus sp. TRP TaxID=412597 RepID=UPI000225F3D2|nr:hypothetical protein [Paracoccus sp. TRP]
MTSIITAAEARSLDPALQAPAVLDRLDKMIREAACRGAKELRVPRDLVEASSYRVRFWASGVSEALKEAGYIITPRIHNLEHMDAWLEISWRTA